MAELDARRFTLHLDNERMFLAWLRVSAILMGAGYAIARGTSLFYAGVALAVGGAAALVVSSSRYHTRLRCIDRGLAAAPHPLFELNERTLLAWLRTATALLVLGCAIVQLGVYLQRHAITRVTEAATFGTGMVMLFVGSCAVILGIDDYHRRRSALATGKDGADDLLHSRSLYSLAILVGIAGMSLVVLLAFLH